MGNPTPGPWMVADKGYGWDHFAAIVTPTGIVANCHIAALSRDYAQTAADARLIASAPDLLEALEAMERNTVNLYRGIAPGGNYGANTEGSDLNESAFADNDEIVKAARAAIARARGESA